MKHILKSILTILAGTALLSGCTDNFEYTNTDPNNPLPESSDPKFMFLYAQSRSMFYAQNWQQSDQLAACHFAQFAANDGLSASDYNIDSRYIQGTWDLHYNALSNLNTIIRTYEEQPLHNNIVQMAKIWRCWLMLRLTDYLGDIPYTKAASAEGEAAPYDTQKDIYYTMFEELKQAASAMDLASDNRVGTYDLLYGGDAQKWITFANSLRLRMALRIADVEPEKAKTEAQLALQEGVFISSDQEAWVAMGESSAETNSKNAINYHAGSGVIHMSTAYYRLVENLGGQKWPTAADKVRNANITDEIVNARIHPETVDPRAPIHFEPSGIVEQVTTAALDRNWGGTDPGNVSSGVGAAMVTGQYVNDYAKIGPFFYGSPSRPWPLMKYSEVCFLQAIAIERGLIQGDAKSFYEKGVRADMDEYGVPEEVVDAYLASTQANYYGTSPNWDDRTGTCNTALDKILTQKWISHFVEGSWEAWADHRQYHKPTLMPFAHVSESVFTMSAAAHAGNLPEAYIKRGFYPTSEATNNKAHLEEAIARMGSNSIQNNVWWDVD